jgi:hypothetical protein
VQIDRQYAYRGVAEQPAPLKWYKSASAAAISEITCPLPISWDQCAPAIPSCMIVPKRQGGSGRFLPPCTFAEAGRPDCWRPQ